MIDEVQKHSNYIKNEKVNGVVNRPMRSQIPERKRGD
jgi:hypothetical protein